MSAVSFTIHKIQTPEHIKLYFQRLTNSSLPAIIGISAKLLTYPLLQNFLQQVSGIKTQVIIGNIGMKRYIDDLLQSFPSIIIASGEGEIIFQDSILFIEGRKNIHDIKHIRYQDPATHQLVSTSDAPHMRLDFSFNPPHIHLVEQNIRISTDIYIESSRGCSWGRCTFCTVWDAKKSSFRAKPVESMIVEFEALKQYGVKYVNIIDNDFFGPDPQRVNDLDRFFSFAQKKIGANNPLYFSIITRLHSFYKMDDSPELAQAKVDCFNALISAGLTDVFTGLDALTHRQRKFFNKGASLEDWEGAKRIIDSLNCNVDYGLMIFDPFKTLAEIEEDLTFIKQYELHNRFFNFSGSRMTLWHDSPLLGKVRAAGLLGEYNDKGEPYPCYTYFFKDTQVQQMYDAIYSIWHEEHKKLVWMLKPYYCGPIDIRKPESYKQGLNQFYLELMEDLIETMKKGAVSDKQIEELIYLYRQKRMDYLISLVKKEPENFINRQELLIYLYKYL